VQKHPPSLRQHVHQEFPCQLALNEPGLGFIFHIKPEEDFRRGSVKLGRMIRPHVHHGIHARLAGKGLPCTGDMLAARGEDLIVYPGQENPPALSIQPPFDDGERADYTPIIDIQHDFKYPMQGGQSNGSCAIIIQAHLRHDVQST
jgi:hypothetical protein